MKELVNNTHYAKTLILCKTSRSRIKETLITHNGRIVKDVEVYTVTADWQIIVLRKQINALLGGHNFRNSR